jgi:hypothetical protein
LQAIDPYKTGQVTKQQFPMGLWLLYMDYRVALNPIVPVV